MRVSGSFVHVVANFMSPYCPFVAHCTAQLKQGPIQHKPWPIQTIKDCQAAADSTSTYVKEASI